MGEATSQETARKQWPGLLAGLGAEVLMVLLLSESCAGQGWEAPMASACDRVPRVDLGTLSTDLVTAGKG